MNDDKQAKKIEFLKQLDILFSNVKQWCANTDLTVSSCNIELNEEDLGVYSVEKLIISNGNGKEIAQLVPFATCIIAANGRIDFKGLRDDFIIVLLDKGGPKFTTTVNEVHEQVKYWYKGINEDGWYWIEHKRNRGYLFDSELFFELLAEISNYESK